MGTINRFRFSKDLTDRFPIFIETGTRYGAGVKFAQQADFKRIFSIEIDDEVVDQARKLFADDPRVIIVNEASPTGIAKLLDRMPEEVAAVFWLDAHSAPLEVPFWFGQPPKNNSEVAKDIRLPLEDELCLIRDHCPNSIVIVDDLRLYVDGPFTSGNVPLEHVGLDAEDRRVAAKNIFSILADTHDVISYYEDEGYLVFVPRGCDVRPEWVKWDVREYCEMARAYFEVGDLHPVRGAYYEVLKRTDPPDTGLKRIARGEACRFFAAEAHDASNVGTECDWFGKAISADPLCIEYRLDFVTQCLLPLQWIEQARSEAARACRIAPEDPRVWQVMANVEREASDAKAMEKHVKKALEVGPENPGSHLIAAQCYGDTARFDKALEHYQKLLDLDARRSEALHGMAIIYDRMGDTLKAIDHMNQAIAMNDGVDQTLARWNRSEMLLTMGQYEQGWEDHIIRFNDQYRGRELAAFGRLGKRFKAPYWKLDDPPCRLHVHAEMGYGDVICMARYIPALVRMGHDVRYEVPPLLVDLLAHSFPDVKVQEFAIDYPGALGLSEFDEHVTIMAFPHIFRTTLDTIPWEGPFIKAPPLEVEKAKQKLLGAQGLKIGVCWSCGIRPGLWYTEYGQRKSMDFSWLQPMFKELSGDVTWQLFDYEGKLKTDKTFAETAGMLANLDLVITVDTAMAHLAGAMGIPTWLAMHSGGSWHWGRGREDSPWYPSVRLFRQQHPHEWGDVVARMTAELKKLVARREAA